MSKRKPTFESLRSLLSGGSETKSAVDKQYERYCPACSAVAVPTHLAPGSYVCSAGCPDEIRWPDLHAVPVGTKPPIYNITVRVRLKGPDGNAYFILGRIGREMKRGGVPAKQVDAFMSEATSSDYEHLLATCRKWIDFRAI